MDVFPWLDSIRVAKDLDAYRGRAQRTAVDVWRGREQYVDVCTSMFIACNLRTDVHDGRISDVFPMSICVVGAVAALLVPGGDSCAVETWTNPPERDPISKTTTVFIAIYHLPGVGFKHFFYF